MGLLYFYLSFRAPFIFTFLFPFLLLPCSYFMFNVSFTAFIFAFCLSSKPKPNYRGVRALYAGRMSNRIGPYELQEDTQSAR
jgi:hypothetical protein